jgi:hypothetical protein
MAVFLGPFVGSLAVTHSFFTRHAWWWLCVLCACSAADTGTSSSGDPSGQGDGDGDMPDSADLRVEPANAELFSTSSSAATRSFRVFARDGDTEREVTAEAELKLADAELGSVSGAVLTASTEHAGETELVASFGGERARANVRMHLSIIRIADGAPADAPARFDAATDDPALAPEVVYPSHATLIPPNLGDLEVHFTGEGELYEVTVEGDLAGVRLYTTGRPGEAGTGAWERIAAADWPELVRGTDELTVGVRALAGARAGESAIQVLHLTSEPMKGGIYYWSPPGGIFRHDFAKADEAAELVYGAGSGLGGGNLDNCVGCHALSPDGRRMAVSTDVLQSGAATVIDVASGEQLFGPSGTSFRFATFDPSGERLVTVFQGKLSMRDAATGMEVASVDSGGTATHPDWSPEGDRLVFARIGAPAALTLGDAARAFGLPVPPFGDLPIGAGLDLGDIFFTGGSLWLSRVNGTYVTETHRLYSAPSGQNAYYPSFSPDGRWVLFNQSSGDSYNDGDARLLVLPATGGEPTALAAADGDAESSANSWPRWAPFEQNTARGQERVLWFTFSSVRAFGVRSVAGARPQLWMAAFFPGRHEGERSSPAFRLPFQDLATGNHIAQWTREVVVLE